MRTDLNVSECELLLLWAANMRNRVGQLSPGGMALETKIKELLKGKPVIIDVVPAGDDFKPHWKIVASRFGNDRPSIIACSDQQTAVKQFQTYCTMADRGEYDSVQLCHDNEVVEKWHL